MAKLLNRILKKKKKSKKSKDEYDDTYQEVDAVAEYDQLHFYESCAKQKSNSESVKPSGPEKHKDDYMVPDIQLGVSTNHLMVAAIDLGTSASGYAYSFKHDFKNNPLKIFTHIWTSTTAALSTLKTPTCILFNPQGVFDSFGYDAQNRYAELFTDAESERKDWYFFQNFKMTLYENQINYTTYRERISSRYFLEKKNRYTSFKQYNKTYNLTIRTEIKAENSKSMAAITVFSEAIRYLKNDLIKRVNNMLVGLTEDDILWTLTVPAIWNDTAKLFMRKAAEMSGIQRSKLLLALEPEAGAIYCKQQPVEVQRYGDKSLVNSFQPGSSYMVVDIGGGTVDITIHEVGNDGKLKETYAANGGPWGGNFVNQEYLEIIIDIVGRDVFDEFRLQCNEDYLDMVREFEVKKQNFKIEDLCMKVRVPLSLSQMFIKHKGNLYSDISSRVRSYQKYNKVIEVKKDRLIFKNEIIKSIFSTTVDAIIDHMDKILQQNITVESILLIGGFSECSLLQNNVRSHFETKTIIIPSDPSLSVLKGAVIFGHDQGIVSSRVLKCTYGMACSHNFIEGVHDPSKAYFKKSLTKKCADIFCIIAKMGDSMAFGCASKENYILIDEENIETAQIGIFVSTVERSPKYITDAGCRKIGHISVKLSGNKNDKRRKLHFSIKFGETEIKVLYRQDGFDVSGEKLLDLLQDNP